MRVNRIQTQEFIQQKFAEYYRQNVGTIQPPPHLKERELAFLLFRERTMLRHKAFKNTDGFRNFLQSIAPSDVYYSSAYYEKPEEEMDAKDWMGADIIFDIDADHIPTPCNKQHDAWTCKKCGTSGRGAKPEKCPKCAGQKFDTIGWPCDICLASAKEETMKLVDVLQKDFGFSPQEMKLAFSGHRGYHVHIENETIRMLDSMARKEIVDYMLGIGLEPKLLGFGREPSPKLEDVGWRGRIAKGTYGFLLAATIEQLEKAGLKKKAATRILQQRNQILESWKGKGPWRMLKGVGLQGWESIIQQGIERQSVKIDTVVTTDIHRLIRLSNTLHGETGLKKVEVLNNEIDGFDPFKSAIAFKHDTISLYISTSPKIRLDENIYGPYKNQKIELPTAAAMLLLCKGAAKIEEETANVQ